MPKNPRRYETRSRLHPFAITSNITPYSDKVLVKVLACATSKMTKTILLVNLVSVWFLNDYSTK